MTFNVPSIEKHDSPLDQDLSAAEKFLQFLDPEANHFCFRTYGDKDKYDPALRGNLTGKFNQHKHTLISRNKAGASICVVVNAGGHTDAQIKRVRFVFAYTDGVSPTPLCKALEPHALVDSSARRYHLYWRVDDVDVDSFRSIQKAIAKKYGTDGVIYNPSRIMRIPGFLHHKNEPYLSQIRHLDFDRPAYSANEIISGLGLDVQPENQTHTSTSPNPEVSISIEEAEACLTY